MALLEILTIPDPRVREVARPVEKVDRSIRTLMDNMAETLYDVDAAGLASIQVGQKKRVIVIDRKAGSSPLMMANPEIQWISEETQIQTEGCFSVPGPYEKVERPLKLKVSYLDEENTPQILLAESLLAHCIHHEIEHLDGILFIDHLSPLKRSLAIQKAMKNKRFKK